MLPRLWASLGIGVSMGFGFGFGPGPGVEAEGDDADDPISAASKVYVISVNHEYRVINISHKRRMSYTCMIKKTQMMGYRCLLINRSFFNVGGKCFASGGVDCWRVLNTRST